MFGMFTNNVTKTSSDAACTAPSSSCAKISVNTGVVAGIAVAVPVISVLISLDCAIIICMSALLLNAIILLAGTHSVVKKVKPKPIVL